MRERVSSGEVGRGRAVWDAPEVGVVVDDDF